METTTTSSIGQNSNSSNKLICPWCGVYDTPEDHRFHICEFMSEGLQIAVNKFKAKFYVPPEPPKPPEWYYLIIPSGIPLTFFEERAVEYDRRHLMVDRVSLTVEQAKPVLAELAKLVTLPAMIASCTPHGAGDRIKTNKPTDGIMAYVWRMARFNNGDDPTMPVTAYFDLADGLSKILGKPVSTALINEGLKLIVTFLDQKADELVTATGGDRYAGARRWGRAMGI